MVACEEDAIARAHSASYLGEPAIYISQGLRVPSTIAAMTPQHIEFNQVDEQQPLEVAGEIAQRSSHAVPVRLGMIALRQPASGEEVFDLANADHILAVLLEHIEQRDAKRRE